MIVSSRGRSSSRRGAGAGLQDDPLQTYVFPDPIKRALRSPGHFAPLLRYGLQFGEVLTTAGAPAGAAVWLGPNAWEVTPERATAAGLDQLPIALGTAAAERFFSVLAAIDPYHHRDVPAEHWYVMVVGLRPAWEAGRSGAFAASHGSRDAASQPCAGDSPTEERRLPRTSRLPAIMETVDAERATATDVPPGSITPRTSAVTSGSGGL
jgi:hypothetical protein